MDFVTFPISLAFGAVARLHVVRRNNAHRAWRQAVFFLSAPLRPSGVGVVLLQPNTPQRCDGRRLKQTRQSRGGLQSVEQGVSIKPDLNGQPCARAFFFRKAVFVKPSLIAFRPIAPLGFQASPHPIRRNRGDGIERVLKAPSDVLKVIERTDGSQNMRRVGTLPPTRLEPFAFAADLDQLFKKQGFGLPLKQPRAELTQDRIVKARRVERQGERVFPINAAAHGVEISRWYARRYGVEIDPETEAIATIGAKEGFSHLVMALVEPGDKVIVPDPSYPIHSFAATIASCELIKLPISQDLEGGPEAMMDALRRLDYPRSQQPKLLVLSFPHNPTTVCVEEEFFEEAVAIARERGYLIIHDLAYADLTFDGYKAPSILQAPGAKDVAVEMFSMSKSYSMAGWRVGFCVGNRQAVAALTRIKSYLDYGMFQPIQIAAIIALRDCDYVVPEIVEVYRKRRDALIKGLNSAGWNVPAPKGTMFVWAKIPDQFAKLGSLEFAKLLIEKAGVAVSPGVGFGERGDHYVRFALVENEQRIAQAVRGIRSFLHD